MAAESVDLSVPIYVTLGWLLLGLGLSIFGWPAALNNRRATGVAAIGYACAVIGGYILLGPALEDWFYRAKVDSEGVSIRTFTLLPSKSNGMTFTTSPREWNFKYSDLESLDWHHANAAGMTIEQNGVRLGADDKDIVFDYKLHNGQSFSTPSDAKLGESEAAIIARSYLGKKIPETIMASGLQGPPAQILYGQGAKLLKMDPASGVQLGEAIRTGLEHGGYYTVISGPGRVTIRDLKTSTAIVIRAHI